MLINLNELLTIILYTSLIVLVIILIVLGIKLMNTLKKIDIVIGNVNNKLEKVDGVFDILDKTTNYANSIGDKIISVVSGLISSLLGKKKGNDEDE